jgi:hypothetical protein
MFPCIRGFIYLFMDVSLSDSEKAHDFQLLNACLSSVVCEYLRDYGATASSNEPTKNTYPGMCFYNRATRTTHSKAATNLGAGSQACLSRARLVHQTRHLLTAENRRLMPMAQRTQRTYARLRWQGTDPALESCRCLNVGWALQGLEALTDLKLGRC